MVVKANNGGCKRVWKGGCKRPPYFKPRHHISFLWLSKTPLPIKPTPSTIQEITPMSLLKLMLPIHHKIPSWDIDILDFGFSSYNKITHTPLPITMPPMYHKTLSWDIEILALGSWLFKLQSFFVYGIVNWGFLFFSFFNFCN